MVILQHLYYVLSISSRGLFLMMMMMMSLVFAGPTGLTLKLIHRDSPESPLYPGNLTQLERMDRDLQRSIDREEQLTTWLKSSWASRNNSTNSKSIDTVRPKVSIDSKTLYMVKIGIGMFPNPNPRPPAPPLIPHEYFLLVDTGSDLLWLQCEGRNKVTFLQNEPLFDGKFSSTFHPLPANTTDRVCKKFGSLKVGPYCGYDIRYGDGAGTAGVLATERLTFDSAEAMGSEGIDNFVFGCGLKQNEPSLGRKPRGQNPIAGIFGLGGGVGSFIRQLGNRAQNKFEYCFKPWYDNTIFDTFLRFGSDTKIVDIKAEGVQTTSIVPTRGETVYYAIMEGISVDGERVVYPEGSNVFASRPDGSGGCIFDTGTPMTQLSAQVYDPFKNHLIRYLSRKYKIPVVRPKESRFELCFGRPSRFKMFPSITFHFTGADFRLEPGGVFGGINEETFCLNIRRTGRVKSYSVVLGSNQQINHRILHDLRAMKISWEEIDCALKG